MAIRIPWTKYEVALLIDACIRFDNTQSTRTGVIKELSKKLRELAIKNNIEIDDIYRNENGITMQFTIMQSLLHNKESGLHNASKLFVGMKDLYYQDKSLYDKILMEAQTMLESNKKNQDSFVEWLSAQVSPAQLSELYMVYDKIDKFCIQRGMLKKPLIETTDIKMLNKVLKMVEQNKVFRFTHKREINKIVSAVRHYYNYIKNQEEIKNDDLDIRQKHASLQGQKAETTTVVISEKEQLSSHNEITPATTEHKENSSLTRTTQDETLLQKYPIAYKKIMDSLRHSLEVVGEKGVTANAIYENIKHIARMDSIEEILYKASWAKKNGNRYIFTEEIIEKNEIVEENNDDVPEEVSSEQSKVQKVDFYNLSNLAFTKPSSFSYFGETVVDLRSWTDLYVGFVRFLYEDYPAQLPLGQLFHGANRIDFGDYDLSQKMIAPKQFADNLYVETNLSANNIVGKIKALLELCLVDYENVIITYQKKKSGTTDTSPNIFNNNSRCYPYCQQVTAVLRGHYQYGFRLESTIDMKRFRRYAEELDVVLPESDDVLKAEIRNVGVKIEDKIYLIEADTFGYIRNIIDDFLSGGSRILFYDCIYNSDMSAMEAHYITEAEQLKAIIKQCRQNIFEETSKVYFAKNFVSFIGEQTERNAVTTEIQRVWGDNQTMHIEELHEQLPAIPEEHIRRYLSGSADFVWISEGVYFSMQRFVINESQKKAILSFVAEECDNKGYASISDVPFGSIKEENYELSTVGLQEAIYNEVLLNQYHLKGKILTRDDKKLDVVTLLKQYLADKAECTFDEADSKVNELAGTRYRYMAYEGLYDTMVRTDKNHYLAPHYVKFDVDAIDKVLSEMIKDRFVAIKEITSFALFPLCGVPWNHYLLESYCYLYSKKYCLKVVGFNDKNSGIIAESIIIDEYNELLAQAAARAKIELNAEAVGQYFFETGYMGKRRFSDLESIVERAVVIRKDL